MFSFQCSVFGKFGKTVRWRPSVSVSAGRRPMENPGSAYVSKYIFTNHTSYPVYRYGRNSTSLTSLVVMAFETIVNRFNHAQTKLREGNVFSHVCLFGGKSPSYHCRPVQICSLMGTPQTTRPCLDLFTLLHLLHMDLLVRGRLTVDWKAFLPTTYYSQWRIQDFPEERAPTPQGAPKYDFVNVSQKLHEIERIWTRGGGVPRAPLDPPLKVLRPVFQWINGLNITFAIIFCNLPLQYLFTIDFCLKVFSFSFQNMKSTIWTPFKVLFKFLFVIILI